MRAKMLPDTALLRQLLRYDEHSGKLYWLDRTIEHFYECENPKKSCSSWNGRYAGKEAFTHKNNCGYMCGFVLGESYLAHRIAWRIFYDESPNEIDHINGMRSDNRIVNLRSVTFSENARNKKIQSNNTSGCAGVCFSNKKGKWIARIKLHGKFVCLGSFTHFDGAVAARKNAEVTFGFHKNHGRP